MAAASSILASLMARFMKLLPYRRLRYDCEPPMPGVGYKVLPDLAGWRVHHRLTRFATEGVLELGHVRHHAVDARKARRVRVGDGTDAQVLRPFVLARPLRHADKEALVWREAVGVRQLLLFGL